MHEMIPPPRGERFTIHAIAALKHGEAVATQLHHDITSAHVLLGIIRSGNGIAGRVVEHIGLYPEPLEAWLNVNVMHTEAPSELSAETKWMLERSVIEARRLNQSYVGSEHFLLAITRPTRRLFANKNHVNLAHRALIALAVPPMQLHRRVLFELATLR